MRKLSAVWGVPFNGVPEQGGKMTRKLILAAASMFLASLPLLVG
jgi:hypothetical protein